MQTNKDDARRRKHRATMKKVREQYPDAYIVHGMWCGPGYEEAEALYKKLQGT